jgi:hypothetical protein
MTKMDDPSALTTQQLWREIEHVKELLMTELSGIKQSIKIAHDDFVRVPTDVQKAVGTLRDFHDEKFKSIEKQFEMESAFRLEQKTDTKTAIDAALAAQEKQSSKQAETFAASINKSEAAVNKQLDLQSAQTSTITSGLGGQISDIKERLAAMDSRGAGRKDMWGWVAGAIFLLIAIASFFSTRF